LREVGIVNSALPPLETNFTPRYFKPEWLEKIGPGEIEHAVPWGTLTEEQRKLQATKMAIHAAMVDRMDREIGRVLDQLRTMGAFENTVIFFLSDNGADATLLIRGEGHDPQAPPGSWRSFLCLGPGWASASNAPFRRHKIWVHEGGIATPLIVHWPKGITARGELRHAPGHVIDFVPTLLDLAGARPTNTWNGAPVPPLPGRSLVPVLARDGTLEREFLFFQHEGNRALRQGNWKLVSAREDEHVWELYDLSQDRGELNNLSAQYPDRLRELAQVWTNHEAACRTLANVGSQDRPRLNRPAAETNRANRRPEGTQR
jgi:arylsulfatase